MNRRLRWVRRLQRWRWPFVMRSTLKACIEEHLRVERKQREENEHALKRTRSHIFPLVRELTRCRWKRTRGPSDVYILTLEMNTDMMTEMIAYRVRGEIVSMRFIEQPNVTRACICGGETYHAEDCPAIGRHP
jgi:hypothetical protein